MTLKQYKEKLSKHDWHYAMSSDRRWYESGLAEEQEIKKLAETKLSFKKAYEAKKNESFPKS